MMEKQTMYYMNSLKALYNTYKQTAEYYLKVGAYHRAKKAEAAAQAYLDALSEFKTIFDVKEE